MPIETSESNLRQLCSKFGKVVYALTKSQFAKTEFCAHEFNVGYVLFEKYEDAIEA